MKTTFKEVFNNFQDDIINCEDMNIDIDIDKVKEQVFNRLNTDMEKNKKRNTKKFRVMLIAAVVAVSMILGTTAYATGALDSIFGGFFGGNMNSAGLYDGKNVTFESPDPNINAQLLGIIGDERQAYAMIEVRHKDGTPLTDEGYNYAFLCSDETEDNCSYEDLYKAQCCDAYFIDKNGKLVGHVYPGFDMAKDAKTLKILIKIPNGNINISDYTLVVENRFIGANKVLEVVATKETLDSEYEIFR